MSTKDHVLDFIAVWHESSPRSGHGSGGSTCSLFSIWHSSLHTFGIRLECSRPPMFLRTILVLQNIPASLTHSVSSVLRAALSPFWMLRCLLVALRRSGCACCYGSVPTAPRRSCVQLAAGWVVVGFSIWHSSLHTFGIRLECSRPPMFLRTILVLQNIPASLTHSVSSVLRAALSPFWMLRCLLVALRRSGCACCYGSVPTIVVRLELAIVSHVIGDNFAAVCGGRSRLGYSVLPIGFCMLDPGVGGLVPRSSGCLRVFGTICLK